MATIAKNFGVSTTTVHKDLAKALEGLSPYESREKLFQMELQRLDAMYAAFFSSAVEGDIPAADMCLKIQNQRARLCGLYPDREGGGININLGGDRANAEDAGIQVVFVRPDGSKHQEPGEVLPFNRPAPLRLVEHVPERMPDPPFNPMQNVVPDGAFDNLPPAREHTPPVHPEVVNDRSKVLPDPKGPRTEFDLPAAERRPNVLHESLFIPRKPPKGAA